MFHLQSILTVSDLINSVLLVVAIIGIFITYRQMKEGYKTQKASFFKDLYLTMWSDREIRDTYYDIEYNKIIYNINFHGSTDEKRLDHLLCFTDLICELYSQRVITDN